MIARKLLKRHQKTDVFQTGDGLNYSITTTDRSDQCALHYDAWDAMNAPVIIDVDNLLALAQAMFQCARLHATGRAPLSGANFIDVKPRGLESTVITPSQQAIILSSPEAAGLPLDVRQVDAFCVALQAMYNHCRELSEDEKLKEVE